MDEKVIQAGMFNQRSTGSERQELLQSILREEADDEDEENEVMLVYLTGATFYLSTFFIRMFCII